MRSPHSRSRNRARPLGRAQARTGAAGRSKLSRGKQPYGRAAPQAHAQSPYRARDDRFQGRAPRKPIESPASAAPPSSRRTVRARGSGQTSAGLASTETPRTQHEFVKPLPKPLPPGSVRVGLLTAAGVGRITRVELALREIPFNDSRIGRLRGQDLLVGTVTKELVGKLRRLRTVEDIFVLVQDEIPIRQSKDLARLRSKGLKDQILNAIPFLPKRGKKRGTHFWVFVKQDHDYEVERREIAQTLVGHIQANFSHWSAQEPAEVELWGFYSQSLVTVGLRLTDVAFRQRNYREGERPGALRPTLAATLITLSHPTPHDYVIDPMCGTGTLLIERALWGPCVALVGGDRDVEALEIARASAKLAHAQVNLTRWDALSPHQLHEHTGKATHLLCNLPFGKQFPTAEGLGATYLSALKSWAPLLAPGGRMILLTSEFDALKGAASAAKLKSRRLESLEVKGVRAAIVEVTTR